MTIASVPANRRQDQKLLTSSEAAAYIGLSHRTFQRMVAENEPIPAVLGRKRRWYLAEKLDAWWKSRER